MPKGVFHCNLAFFTTTRQRETGHEAIDRITLPKEGNRVVVMTEGGLEGIAARFPVKTVIVTCQIGSGPLLFGRIPRHIPPGSGRGPM